jgi:glutathione peroxidase
MNTSQAALIIASLTLLSSHALAASSTSCPEAFNQPYQKLHSSKSVNLCELTAGKVALVVNTASHCGYTKQFSGLEKLHQQFKDQGLVVIGVPSNDFRQEASDEAKTAKVCYQNYGVSFTMLAPQKVKGSSASELFKYLAEEHSSPRWNFNKYLLDQGGKVKQYYGSSTAPGSKKLGKALAELLESRTHLE